MASVTPRRNRDGSVSWRVQFRMGQPRKMCQETFSGDGAEVAARQFGQHLDRVGPEAALATLRARNNATVGVPTFGQFAATYLDPSSGLLTGVQNDTRSGYQTIVDKSFLPLLGELPINAITKHDIGSWLAWQESQQSGRTKGQPISQKTVKNRHALLSAIFAAAVEAGHRTDNPAYKMALTRGRKHQAVFLSHTEFYTLLHFIPAYYKPLVRFLVLTGMRWSEATAVERRDVNLATRPATVTVSKAWKRDHTVGPPKTEKGYRTLPLRPDLVAQLELDGPGGDFLFQGAENGGRLWYGNFKARIWDRAVKKAMDPDECAAVGRTPLPRRPTPHDLRHTYASWLIGQGAPLNLIQRNLGHENITTTVDTYGHLSPTAHEDTVTALYAAMPDDPLAITA
ncbi:site-specific integrase [Curtobacterium flaccumfaciens pv. flaccumfaciens]|uniref:Site-specific integrase n=1 Tax=Curtobacterium flaccumfaciens pv. flaccumfaciens TaxID=138532 RepID=A0A9Q2ZPV6_9MICO|nr:site-specific integrase [Curtobacterium flaccumfaciens]MBT1542498.1 site-specific integrase [Curtobacterium flaccumfaciens pv. flaccumfaciens]